MKKFGNLLLAAVKAFGAREIFMVFGLAALGYGISLVNLPAAFITVGSIMVGVAIFGVKAAVSAAPPTKTADVVQFERRNSV